MTYLACSRAEIIASKFGTSKKRKKSIFSIFAVSKELKSFLIYFCEFLEAVNTCKVSGKSIIYKTGGVERKCEEINDLNPRCFPFSSRLLVFVHCLV